MIVQFSNTQGYIKKKVKLTDDFYTLKFMYNYRDEYWYLSIDNYLDNLRIVKDRVLFETEYGYLTTNSELTKTGFTSLEWVEI